MSFASSLSTSVTNATSTTTNANGNNSASASQYNPDDISTYLSSILDAMVSPLPSNSSAFPTSQPSAFDAWAMPSSSSSPPQNFSIFGPSSSTATVSSSSYDNIASYGSIGSNSNFGSIVHNGTDNLSGAIGPIGTNGLSNRNIGPIGPNTTSNVGVIGSSGPFGNNGPSSSNVGVIGSNGPFGSNGLSSSSVGVIGSNSPSSSNIGVIGTNGPFGCNGSSNSSAGVIGSNSPSNSNVGVIGTNGPSSSNIGAIGSNVPSSSYPGVIGSNSPSSSIGPIGSREYGQFSTNNNNYNQSNRNNSSSSSPGTSSSMSLTCFRCEERVPTMRCLDCNDIFCYECSGSIASECQLKDHTVLLINSISPNGGAVQRPNSSPSAPQQQPHPETNTNQQQKHKEPTCEAHPRSPLTFYCDNCIMFICHECPITTHKGHNCALIRTAQDTCRLSILKALDTGKNGTKFVKTSIDRAVAITKSFDKEATEVTMKIRKAMRYFIHAIEERERYLIEKVERMRHFKLNELNDQMSSLRGVLAGLAQVSEDLVMTMDLEGIHLFRSKHKAFTQLEYFADMYKCLKPADESLNFLQPNYELVEHLKKQGDVVPVTNQNPSNIQVPLPTTLQNMVLNNQIMHPQYTMNTHPSHNYGQSSNSNAPLSNYSSHGTRVINSYGGHSISSTLAFPPGGFSATTSAQLPSSSRGTPPPLTDAGVGRAILGCMSPVVVKENKHLVPAIPMLSFGREGPDDGQISRPWGLCVDRDGNIVVADRRNNRIQIFNSRGEFQFMFGSKGTGNGEFDLPAGITTDANGRIIVVDKDNHRIQIFTSFGYFILKFGSYGKDCGQFQYPWDVAVNSIGHIVVSDTRNHRIQLFTTEGVYLTKFVFEGANPAKLLKGPSTPRGVCFTTSGTIIVTDFENHRLMVMDPMLSRILNYVGREGSGMAELSRPSGIVCDDEGNIIVADSKNHRILILSRELRYKWSVDVKSPGLDDKDRPSDVALTADGNIIVLFETLPDSARDVTTHGKEYIKVY